MIDQLVLTKLESFLTNKTGITTLLRETGCRPAQIENGLGIASKLARSLSSGAVMAEPIADLLARVTVRSKSLNISIKRERLLARLADAFVDPSQEKDQDDIISLEATVSAAGAGSRKLVFADQNAKTPDAVVIKAIARASVWFENLTAGKSKSMAEIAAREDITDNYVSNLIHLAWLPPDVVGRVLDGDAEVTGMAKRAMLTRKSDAVW
jgi:ParB-like chromosome segregation protein Spo0J